MQDLPAPLDAAPAVPSPTPAANRGARTTSSRRVPVHTVQAQLKILNIWNVDTVAETFNVEMRICSRWEVTALPGERRSSIKPSTDCPPDKTIKLTGALSSFRCGSEHAKDALENGLDQLDVDWEPEWVPRFSLWGCISREDGRKDYTAQRRGESEVWIEGAQWITAQLGAEHAFFGAIFIPKTIQSICQDRLGTSIGKVERDL